MLLDLIRALLVTSHVAVLVPTQQPTQPPAPEPTPTAPALEPAFRFLQQPPRGLPPMPAPDGYQPTEAMFRLGEDLFADRILSKDRSVACATCHPAANGFASPEPRPAGVDGKRALLHAPVLWNRGYGSVQRWSGSSPSLETFVLEPIADENEMGLPVAQAIERLAADASYRRRFEQAFGAPPSTAALQQSLATFVRGIVAGDAPYDRFLAGDVNAMTQPQRTGQWIFESKGRCWQCHTPPLFTDESFHNTGVGVRDGRAEPGRAAHTRLAADTGKWKTPTLRQVHRTAPYMHDGSLPTLAEVVAFYSRGGNPNPELDRRMQPLHLTAAEQQALVAFLESL